MATATVIWRRCTLTINSVNDAPNAANDSFTTPVNQLLVILGPGVLGNDVDAEGDALSSSVVVGPAHGTLLMGADGGFLYTPAHDFHGADSFTYAAKDATASGTATVAITVNSPPTTVADSLNLTEDVPFTSAATGVLANDSDPDNDPFTADSLLGPGTGTIVLGTNGAFTYSPNQNFNGIVTFTYRADDGLSSSERTTVTLNIQAVNDAPQTTADAYQTDEDIALVVAANAGFLSNDTDVDNDPISGTVVAGPAHGLMQYGADGAFTYTPEQDFHGTDSFVYRASDSSLAESPDTTVVITVNSVSDAPVPTGDNYDLDEGTTLAITAPGVLQNDSDGDGDTLHSAVATPPANGSVVLGTNGSFTYIPDANFHGTDSFSYTANDGSTESSPAVVVLTVHAINHAPTAADDNYMIEQDTPRDVPVGLGVLANDSDPDAGATLHATVVTGPQHGTLVLADDGHFLYTPDSGYTGPDSFTYEVSDGSLHDQALVSLAVQLSGGGEGESNSADMALLAYLMSSDAGHEHSLSLFAGPSNDWAAAVDQTLAELYA